MSSSPIEARGIVAEASGPTAAEARRAIRDRRWHKRLLPRSLFGRALLIIVTPLILVQVIATWVFYDRHWDTVARRLSTGVAGDIAQTIDTMRLLPPGPQRDQMFERVGRATELEYIFWPDEKLPAGMERVGTTSLEEQLAAALIERVHRPFQIDAEFDPRDTLVSIALYDGVLQVAVPKKRLFTPTTYIFVMWMTGSSLVLFAVATLFMRNQVKSLSRLAAAWL